MKQSLRVSVRLFTQLREIVGEREATLEFRSDRNVTVRAVLKVLSEKYGKAFDDYVFDVRTGEIKGYLQILLNGRSIAASECIETGLVNGDVLAIVPPVSGG